MRPMTAWRRWLIVTPRRSGIVHVLALLLATQGCVEGSNREAHAPPSDSDRNGAWWAEVAMLENGMRFFETGRYAAALRTVRLAERVYPNGQLADERRALVHRIEAALAGHEPLRLSFSGADGCPDESAFRAHVSGWVGQDPFVGAARDTVYVFIGRTVGAFVGRYALHQGNVWLEQDVENADCVAMLHRLAQMVSTALGEARPPACRMRRR